MAEKARQAPTAAGFRKVAETLSRLLWTGEKLNIAMGDPRPNEKWWKDIENVPTLGCLGCAYGMAVKLPVEVKMSLEDWLAGDYVGTEHYYLRGARLLAKDAGLDKEAPLGNLDLWAVENPHLWGNEHGGMMFGSRLAFGHPPEAHVHDTIPLTAIIDHFEAVADRMDKRERITKRINDAKVRGEDVAAAEAFIDYIVETTP